MHYRRNLLSYITLRWDQPNSEPGFSKVSSPFRISTDYVQISLLDALVWIKEAWKEVSIAIISKCFRTCGIGPLTSSSSPKAYSHFCMRSNRPRWMVGRRYAGGLCYNWYVASSLSNLFVDESIDVFEDSFFGRGEYYKIFNSEKRYRIRRSHDHVGWALSQADMLRKFRSANGLGFAPIYPGNNEKTTESQGSVMRTNKQYLMIFSPNKLTILYYFWASVYWGIHYNILPLVRIDFSFFIRIGEMSLYTTDKSSILLMNSTYPQTAETPAQRNFSLGPDGFRCWGGPLYILFSPNSSTESLWNITSISNWKRSAGTSHYTVLIEWAVNGQ